MTEIEIDGRGWVTAIDVFQRIYAAIGAPADAACNMGALEDYLVYGMAVIEPPYRLHISGLAQMSQEARDETRLIQSVINETAEQNFVKAKIDLDMQVIPT